MKTTSIRIRLSLLVMTGSFLLAGASAQQNFEFSGETAFMKRPENTVKKPISKILKEEKHSRLTDADLKKDNLLFQSFYFTTNTKIPSGECLNQLEVLKNLALNELIEIREINSFTDSLGNSRVNTSLSNQRLRYFQDYFSVLESKDSISWNSYATKRPYRIPEASSWRRVDVFYEVLEASEIVLSDTTTISDSAAVNSPVTAGGTKTMHHSKKKTANPFIRSKELVKTSSILNIQFVEGTINVTKKSHSELDYLCAFLKQNPDLSIIIRGHVCCENNMKKSRQRARAVYRILIKNGIDPFRMCYVGMSNSEPLIFPEVSRTDMQTNRRVDIVFVPN